MDANHVASLYPNSFGSFRLAGQQGVSLAATGDATKLVTMPASKYIVRRITLSNFSGAATTCNVGVFTAAGGTGTAIVADAALGSNGTTGKFVDLTLSATANSTVVTNQVLYLNVSTGNAAVTCDVALYGDTVSL